MYIIYLLTIHSLKLFIKDIVIRTALIFTFLGILITHFLGQTIVHEYMNFTSSFGLLIMDLCLAFITIYKGCFSIHSDIFNNAIANLISSSVSRIEIFIGKYSALILLNFINLFVMSLLILSLLWSSNDFTTKHFIAIYTIGVELMFLAAMVLCINTFTSNIITFYCASALYLVGHYTEILIDLNQITNSSILIQLGKVMYFILPNFNIFSTSHFIVNSDSVDINHVLPGSIYSLIYTSVLLFLGYKIFSRKNLQ
jgi:ABC-type transport system involved in multi-copper enzyme maturation permease subunit